MFDKKKLKLYTKANGDKMKIKITADSTCDINEEIVKKYNFSLMPLNIIFEDNIYRDGIDITTDEIFGLVKKYNKLPRTSANNPVEYEEFFKKEVEGYDALIHFSLSSKISSSNQNASLAAEEFKGKVFAVDSASLSTGIALQMIYAHNLAEQGLSASEIYEKINERRDKIQASFVIETLTYLYKGGRCSRLAMFGANLLKIRPVIALKDGKMDVDKKLRGRYDDVVMEYVEYTLEKHSDRDNTCCFLTYSSLDDKLVEKIKERISPLFDKIYITRAGTTVASHCGPNTIGILFYNN